MGRAAGQVAARSPRGLGLPKQTIQSRPSGYDAWAVTRTWGHVIPWRFMPSSDQSGELGVSTPPLTSCFEGVFSKEAHGDLFPGRQGLVPLGTPPAVSSGSAAPSTLWRLTCLPHPCLPLLYGL